METDAAEADLGNGMRRRKKRILREPDFVYQTTERRRKRTAKKAQEGHWDCRLVKIELDAARALAEFSRFAHLPVRLCPSNLRWSERRKRTRRPILKLESRGADEMSGTRMLSSQLPTIELGRTTSLSPDVKASPSYDCRRAESPRSPLPTSKGECKAFFVSKRVSSHSSIEHDVSVAAVQKAIKVEEVESESGFMSSAENQKLRVLNSHLPFSLARESSLGWQAVSRDEGSLHSNVTEPKVKLSPTSKGPQRPDSIHGKDLVVMDALSTPVDKEARRLRRIQANRESARQTIRKKQLLCEELRRRSASLTSENDAMKQKRDILMQEIASLKAQNYHLKVQLDLRVSNHAGSQPSQLRSLKNWPALSVPCSYTAFPSHVYGWPAMMMQEVNGFCQDPLVKKENKGENCQKLQCVTSFGMAHGIPANSLCTSSVKDASSSLYVCMSQEGQNWTGVACIETGLPCDADSVASDSHQTSAEESKPKLASVIQERGSINGHLPQVDCISKYPWRMHHVTPITAAQARKRRKEMTRKKRLVTKASKLLV